MSSIRQNAEREQYRVLLHQYRIEFMGSVPLRQLPREYKSLFKVIYDIKRVQFESHIPPQKDRHATRQQKETVKKIRARAKTLKSTGDYNESTWRDIENHLIERFSNDVNCSSCGKNQWIADFQAFPDDVDARRALESERQDRAQCVCSTRSSSSATNSTYSAQDTFLFHTEKEEIMHHEESESTELARHRISMKPDRVIGLNKRGRLAEYAMHGPENARHHPGDHAQLMYPFCIFEAKRERHAPGFKALEEQTAFPIRRCLELQQSLQRQPGVEIKPLVWFIGYQGDIWRLYGAIMTEGMVRVYDLWLGSVESEDGALQMVLIMDFIWDWAREMYRKEVSTALRSRSTVDHSLPSSTIVSEHNSREATPTPQTTYTPFDETAVDLPFDLTADVSLTAYRPVDGAPIHTWRSEATYEVLGQPTCIFRNANVVRFRFEIIELGAENSPFEPGELMMVIQDAYENELVFTACGYHFQRLGETWLGRVCHSNLILESKYDAIICFRSMLDDVDWAPNRLVRVITWPHQLDHVPFTSALCSRYAACGPDNVCWALSRLFKGLRQPSRAHGMATALDASHLIMRRRLLDLSADTNSLDNFAQWEPIRRWATRCAALTNFLELVHQMNHQEDYTGFVRHESQIQEILSQGPQHKSENPQTPTNEPSALLALRNTEWPPACPLMCCFLFPEDPEKFYGMADLKAALNKRKTIKDCDDDGMNDEVRKSVFAVLKAWYRSLR